VGLERGPFSLVSTTEELLERKSSGSGLRSPEYGGRDPSLRPLGTLYPQTLALASPTSVGRSNGRVRLRTQATEFVFCFLFVNIYRNCGEQIGTGSGFLRILPSRAKRLSPNCCIVISNPGIGARGTR
jgi:hypothetical protein